jgi:NTE family protein
VYARPTATSPLDVVLDIHRVRQYFDVLVRARDVAAAVRQDVTFLDALRRAFLPLPYDRRPVPAAPFSADLGPPPPVPPGRLAVVAGGGSGATACLIGVARALEDAGRRPDVYSLCSGSALFGFPLAAGLTAGEVADLALDLRPQECVDIAWGSLAALPLRLGRGFTGLLRGERLESYFRRHLGERTLGELPIPAYAPIWNVQHNRLEYLGPRTHPDVPVARAIRMAVSMPLFFMPSELDGGHWCDGGIVDILPVHPVLDIEPRCETAIALNVFHPPGFVGEDATGWEREPASILRAASQVRTSQHIALARENLARLRAAGQVILVEPVPYDTVRGAGFYRQFIDTTRWADFMRAGREATRHALEEHAATAAGATGVAEPAEAGPAEAGPAEPGPAESRGSAGSAGTAGTAVGTAVPVETGGLADA